MQTGVAIPVTTGQELPAILPNTPYFDPNLSYAAYQNRIINTGR